MKQKQNMKFSTRMAFVMDMISDRWLLFLLVVLMGIVSFLLVDISVMMVLEQKQTDLLAKEILTVDTDQVYHVTDADLYNIMDTTKQDAFEKELVQNTIWEQLSVYSMTQKNSFAELQESAVYAEIMTEAYNGTQELRLLQQSGKRVEDMMHVYTANQNALDLFGISLSDIAVRDEKLPEGEMYIPVYIGRDLADILDPGQVLSPAFLGYARKDNPDGISLCNCYVAGVLDRGTKGLSEHYTGNDDIAICLDKMILIRNEDIEAAGYITERDTYRNNLYVSFPDRKTMAYELESFKKTAKPLYDKHDMKLSVTSLADLMKNDRTVEKSVQILIMMAILLTIAGFMAFSTTSMIAVLLRKHRYGIMLANGISHADLAFMVSMENICKYTLSFAISFGIMHVFYATNQPIYYSGMNEYMGYLRLHLRYALPIMLILMILGAICASAMPVHIVRKLNLMELLRDA